MGRVLIFKGREGRQIFVEPGVKSKNDFKVKYRDIWSNRLRTPKHIHIIIDLYMKLALDRELTLELVKYVIDEVILKVTPATQFPPKLQIFPQNKQLVMKKFESLDRYGVYPLDFLMVLIELIMIQEKTNYPDGVMNLKLFERFRDNPDDIFAVVSAATYRGGK